MRPKQTAKSGSAKPTDRDRHPQLDADFYQTRRYAPGSARVLRQQKLRVAWLLMSDCAFSECSPISRQKASMRAQR
jgi:hypothetical protein